MKPTRHEQPDSSAAALLAQVDGAVRRSLDRAKFWNTCSQSDSLPTEWRAFARTRREYEAEHRRHLRLFRHLLASGRLLQRPRDLARIAEAVTARLQAEIDLIITLRRFVVDHAPEPVPPWDQATVDRADSG
jgi:hypothetical protein